MSDDLPTTAIIRALWDLHERTQRAPTAEDVAAYLNTDTQAVLAALRGLRKRRLFRDRRTKAGRIWEPWGGRW